MKWAGDEMPVGVVVFLRYGFASAGFLVGNLFSGLPRVGKRDLALVVLVGALNFAAVMFGFQKREEMDLFRTLTTISGLGPKTAMGILSTVEPELLKEAVINEDPGALRQISGLGAKTAQRLVVELQGKVDWIASSASTGGTSTLGEEAQAMEALVALGYSQSQSKEALREVGADATDLSDRVRRALKALGR